jgi:hypothetical protein
LKLPALEIRSFADRIFKTKIVTSKSIDTPVGKFEAIIESEGIILCRTVSLFVMLGKNETISKVSMLVKFERWDFLAMLISKWDAFLGLDCTLGDNASEYPRECNNAG